jgi:hypothetical protein
MTAPPVQGLPVVPLLTAVAGGLESSRTIRSDVSDDSEEQPSVGTIIKAVQLAALLEVAKRVTMALARALQQASQAIGLVKLSIVFYLLYI